MSDIEKVNSKKEGNGSKLETIMPKQRIDDLADL